MTGRRTILVGWELGGGRGHLEPVLPIIEVLLARGWHIVFAMRNTATAESVFARLSVDGAKVIDIRQAPIFLHRAAMPSMPVYTLAEILSNSGFSNSALLMPVVRAWSRLLDEIRPNVILADFAPSLRIAAHSRTPVVMLGNGWTLPPDTSPIPPLLVYDKSDAAAIAAEADICSAVSSISVADWKPDRLVMILRGEQNFVLCPSILDPYRSFRNEPIWWQPNISKAGAPVSKSARNIFAYLPQRHPAHASFVAAMASNGFPSTAYFGGKTMAVPSNLHLSSTPIDLTQTLPGISCVVHHGGLGIASVCLAQGVTQVMLPTDLEKQLNAAAIVNAEFGVALASTATAGAITDAIERARALKINPVNVSPDPQATVDAVITACESYIA